MIEPKAKAKTQLHLVGVKDRNEVSDQALIECADPEMRSIAANSYNTKEMVSYLLMREKSHAKYRYGR